MGMRCRLPSRDGNEIRYNDLLAEVDHVSFSDETGLLESGSGQLILRLTPAT